MSAPEFRALVYDDGFVVCPLGRDAGRKQTSADVLCNRISNRVAGIKSRLGALGDGGNGPSSARPFSGTEVGKADYAEPIRLPASAPAVVVRTGLVEWLLLMKAVVRGSRTGQTGYRPDFGQSNARSLASEPVARQTEQRKGEDRAWTLGTSLLFRATVGERMLSSKSGRVPSVP